MYIPRILQDDVRSSLKNNPVTAILGPRQCGKSTLAKTIIRELENVSYLDLEKPSDLRKLQDPEWFFVSNKEKLFVLDEIHRIPELFPVIRSLTDEWSENGKFLILGSASTELLKQSSESLAGRISYRRLTPFLWNEVENVFGLNHYLCRGGFPRSILSPGEELANQWLDDFISTYLERDLFMWSGFSPSTMRRLWQMLAHLNGQTTNFSSLGSALGVSNMTIRNYIDLLSGTFMVDIIPPFYKNFGKRIIKAPKIYITDTGIVSRLLEISGFEQIAGHPVFGSLWEGLVLANIRGNFPGSRCYFFRTSNGAEVDFIVEFKRKSYVIECKASRSPSLNKGNHFAIETLRPDQVFVVAPVDEGWPVTRGIEVVSLAGLIKRMKAPR